MPFFRRTPPVPIPSATVEDLVARATALSRQGDAAGAVRYYESALTIEPANASVWIRKGNACRDLGDDAGAIRCYNEAILLDPGIAAPWTLKGDVLREQGRFRGAVECYDEALALHPANRRALENRAGSMEALRRSMTVEEWIGWGLSCFDRNAYDRANECYEIALELDPGNPIALKGRASVLARQEHSGAGGGA